MGDAPWGNVFNGAARGGDGRSDDGAIKVAKGFEVEKLYKVPKGEQGSG